MRVEVSKCCDVIGGGAVENVSESVRFERFFWLKLKVTKWLSFAGLLAIFTVLFELIF